ncbi:hypothetical protein [Streptomyces noursei]|uniref:hypothetical protein n=1 Tax=Streptomyces noursei TaxID=1971 RepID=UPI0023B85B78|nr:hypothetical protein [Streptomyces noursei]
MSDDMEDVVGVLTEQIERRFAMSMQELKSTVAVAPDANREATDLVKWHGLLTQSHEAVVRAENALLAALETQHDVLDDPTMARAHRVNATVAARDGRAMVIRWLLDPNAYGKQGIEAERLARLSRGARTGPAVSTSAPPRPAAPASAQGRGTLR